MSVVCQLHAFIRYIFFTEGYDLPVWEKKETSTTSDCFCLENGLFSLACIVIHIMSFPVAQMVEHGASNAKIMGSIPRESKS